jgi:hypothetical protein
MRDAKAAVPEPFDPVIWSMGVVLSAAVVNLAWLN